MKLEELKNKKTDEMTKRDWLAWQKAVLREELKEDRKNGKKE